MAEIIKIGKCKCFYAPMGDYGLEGYILNDIYKYEFIKAKTGEKYYRIYKEESDKFNEYYEICRPKAFKKYFKIIKGE